MGSTGNVDSGRIHGNRLGKIIQATTVKGQKPDRAGRSELGDIAVVTGADIADVRRVRARKGRRTGGTNQINVSARIQCDARRSFFLRSAVVSRKSNGR